MYLFTYMEGKDKEKEFFHLLAYYPNCFSSYSWVGLTPRLENTIWYSTGLARAQIDGPLTAAFPGALAASLIRSREDGTWTSVVDGDFIHYVATPDPTAIFISHLYACSWQPLMFIYPKTVLSLNMHPTNGWNLEFPRARGLRKLKVWGNFTQTLVIAINWKFNPKKNQ